MPVIDPEIDTHKTCSKCRESKLLEEFNKHRGKRDGLQPYCRSCQLANSSAHYESNGEQVRQQRRDYAKANPDKIRLYQREYMRGPGQHRLWELSYRRRAIKAGFIPVIISFTKVELIEEYGDACVDCGGEWTDLEHVVPVAVGGEHSLHNCRPVCALDNARRWHEWKKGHPEFSNK